MTDAQMAFLAERRKAKVRDLSAQPGPSSSSSSQAVAPPEGAGNGSTKYSGYGAFLHDDDDDVNAPMVSQLRVQDCWKCLAGSGLVGDILVCRHVEFGTTIELVKEGSGGFTMQREQGAQVKYCSALCSMQDENRPFAPLLVERVCAGEGSKLGQGIDGGNWGKGILRSNRMVFTAAVKGREGEPNESVELHLTVDGFVFLSAGGLKCIAVSKGEFMPGLTRQEANRLLKDSTLQE